MVRYDEKLDMMFDLNRADDNVISDFFDFVKKMAEKYMPRYEKHVPEEYFSPYLSDFDKALILYKMTYHNFKEIFFQLV